MINYLTRDATAPTAIGNKIIVHICNDIGAWGKGFVMALSKKWKDWAGSIAAQGRLVSNGPRLADAGKVLKAGGVVTDGPFVEIRERLGSFIVVKAESLEDATTLAHGCPALDWQGSVEIRPIM